MTEFIDRDILSIPIGIICHQVNMRGVMGAGLALVIKIKWSSAYDHYRKEFDSNNLYLGRVLFTKVGNRLWVAHMVAQDSYGTSKVQTDYEAFRYAIRQVERFRNQLDNLNIYLPYKIGCGLAGGDWNKILAIIEDEVPNAIICRVEP